MLNKVQLIGRLGKDPEVRSLNNGGKVVSFSMATSESWKDKNSGERKEKTEWHNVVIFNEGIAGVAEKFLKKGHLCYIEGQMQTRKWTDQAGHDRWSTEVVVAQFRGELKLLEGKESGGRAPSPEPDQYGQVKNKDDRTSYGQQSGGGSGGSKGGSSSGGSSTGYSRELDDEIPF